MQFNVIYHLWNRCLVKEMHVTENGNRNAGSRAVGVGDTACSVTQVPG